MTTTSNLKFHQVFTFIWGSLESKLIGIAEERPKFGWKMM
jgi:hypothetical protein